MDALNKIPIFCPSVIILDVMMPKMSGLEVCKKLDNRSNLGIILLTAVDDIIDLRLFLYGGIFVLAIYFLCGYLYVNPLTKEIKYSFPSILLIKTVQVSQGGIISLLDIKEQGTAFEIKFHI